MTSSKGHERLLRWYPPRWRERYGDGFVALIEDTHGTAAMTRGERLSIVRAGLAQRVRALGVTAAPAEGNERLRAGSLLVFSGWSFFLVAFAIFAKFSEHWQRGTPISYRDTPNIGVVVAQVSLIVGMAVVALAALYAGPAFVRFIREGGWQSSKSPVLRIVISCGTVVVLTGALSLWAHSIDNAQRNGSSLAYEVAFIVWSVAVIAAIGVATAAVVTVARRLPFSEQNLRLLSRAALSQTVVMCVVTSAFALWWASEATNAAGVLRGGIGNGLLATSGSLPPALVAAGTMMVLGLALSLTGVRRILISKSQRVSS